MGQKCCAVDEASPQINVQQEQTYIQQRKATSSTSIDAVNCKHHLQKRNFYGKDGEVHSRTITTDMAALFDDKFEQYKNHIFKPPSTIKEETEQSCDSPLRKPPSKTAESSHYTSLYSNFLQNMAEEISKQV